MNPKALAITRQSPNQDVPVPILPLPDRGVRNLRAAGLVLSQTVIGSVTLSCAGGERMPLYLVHLMSETLSAATGGTFIAANYTITYATANMTVSDKLGSNFGNGSRPF